MDASSDDDIQDVISEALKKFGRLDVYFANAGIAGAHPMKTETKDEFLNMMRVNSWR
jgi:NAD(P)-dependent dehydrogenase (short-subunit alcohol dehydrogenase family)